MNKSVYIWACEDCGQYVDTHDLVCTICGVEAQRRTEVIVVSDGAPTGATDTPYVKGFRKGQEYSMDQFTKEVDSFCERVDELVRSVDIITKAVEQIEEQVKDLIAEPLPCIDCGTLVDRSTHKEELGFCVPCQHKYFDEGIER
jgi:rubrerythrin